MGRKHRRRPDAGPSAAGSAPAHQEVEEHPDGEWVVRRVSGAASTKTYRCPGCDHEIRPATPHVVAWPAGERDDDGLGQRRHWHTPCWAARDRRGPGGRIGRR